MKSTTLKEHYQIVIEPARPEDIDEIVALENRAYEFPWSKKILLEEIHGESFSYVYVARLQNHSEAPGKIIGYNFFWVVSDEIHILNLAIDPTYQRYGCGTQLLEFAIHFGQKEGATCVLLEVRVSNVIAQQLYQQQGFQQIGLRKKYYTDNKEDAYVLKKHIKDTKSTEKA